MTDELTALAPAGEQLTLSDGTKVTLRDLKARQFFKLLKILTHGPTVQLMARNGVGSLFAGSPEEILVKFVTYIGISIPDAFDETIEFLYDMLDPAGLTDRTDKASQAENNAKVKHLAEYMSNPELDDVVDLVDAIIERESGDLLALGKKVAKLLNLAKRTGQLPTPQTSQGPSTSEDSPESSTLSVPSTDGLTL